MAGPTPGHDDDGEPTVTFTPLTNDSETAFSHAHQPLARDGGVRSSLSKEWPIVASKMPMPRATATTATRRSAAMRRLRRMVKRPSPKRVRASA